MVSRWRSGDWGGMWAWGAVRAIVNGRGWWVVV